MFLQRSGCGPPQSSTHIPPLLLLAVLQSGPAGVGGAKVGHLVDGEEAKDLARQHGSAQLSAKELEQLAGMKLEDELVDKKGKRTPLHEWMRPGGAGQRVPDQLRVSFSTNVAEEMTVSWVTYAPTTRPYVRFAPLTAAKGCAEMVISGGSATLAHVTNLTRPRVNIEQYVMRAVLQHLLPNTTYAYIVGDYWPQQAAENRGALSDVHYFRTLPTGSRWAPRLLMFGDVGTDTAVPAAKITEFVKRGEADAVFHVGDIAYSLVKNSGTVGDRWMRIMAPFAANVPYMVTPGDHDLRWGRDTWDMQQRFAMPSWRTVAGHPGAVLGR